MTTLWDQLTGETFDTRTGATITPEFWGDRLLREMREARQQALLRETRDMFAERVWRSGRTHLSTAVTYP